MATKTRAHIKERTPTPGRRSGQTRPKVVLDTNVLMKWFKTFDARMAELTARHEALLRDLGVEPAPHKAEYEPVHKSA
ncbi:MAG TPA: hypothetical protein VKI44_13100 [Acetobacteraceae bacterium]|nr:hypothetical protein [Acetobacteraceae bacterium]